MLVVKVAIFNVNDDVPKTSRRIALYQSAPISLSSASTLFVTVYYLVAYVISSQN